jgi:hypothetical protein
MFHGENDDKKMIIFNISRIVITISLLAFLIISNWKELRGWYWMN